MFKKLSMASKMLFGTLAIVIVILVALILVAYFQSNSILYTVSRAT